MMVFWKKTILFYLGGMIYTGIELLWRGRSHWSMFLLGGTCFLGLGRIRRSPLSLPKRIVMAAVMVTALELLTGLMVNREFRVWDYRKMPLNFRGQICLPFFFLWMPLCLVGMGIYGWLDKRLTFFPSIVHALCKT
jgi:uncharacterized membrane protein